MTTPTADLRAACEEFYRKLVLDQHASITDYDSDIAMILRFAQAQRYTATTAYREDVALTLQLDHTQLKMFSKTDVIAALDRADFKQAAPLATPERER